MPQYTYDDLGNRYELLSDGTTQMAPEVGLIEQALIQAGGQFNTYGRGIQNMFADEQGQNELRQEQAAQDEALAGLSREYPVGSVVGQALPALATAPLGAAGLLRSMLLQSGLGAVEGGINLDTADASQLDNALIGGAFGVAGDIGGRILGRVANMAKGLVGDVTLGAGKAANPAAQAFEDLGGSTLAYQRMAQGTRAQGLAERAAQSAQASINPPTQIAEAAAKNDELYRNVAARSVGLDGANYRNLGPEFIDDAVSNMEQGFTAVTRAAGDVGDITLDETTAKALSKSSQIRKLRDLGDFEGLDSNTLTGDEWVTARQALAEDAANAYKNGDGTLGNRYSKMVDELDGAIRERLPDEFLPEFARLREQYRVLSILEKPNVINQAGEINSTSLNRALKAKSGFGRTATRAQETVNPETVDLLNLARAGSNPDLAAFKSSGTAENLSGNFMLESAERAAEGLLTGNPAASVGILSRTVAPGLVGMSEAGGGRAFTGAFSPAPGGFSRGGAAAGRSGLDQLLYPFVGAEDDREY